jgi:hypothetical protein
MGIDWSQFAIPKGPLRVEEKRRKRLDAETLEREARAAVKSRDLGKCRIPGCKERATELHHIVYRSKSKRLMWATANLVSLCKGHHAMEHGGKITISGNADEEIFITGDTKALRFKL